MLGILLSFIFLSFFVYINLNFIEAGEFAKDGYTEKVLNNPSENPFERLNKMIWRFDYLFIPIIIAVVSALVGFMDKSKYRVLLALIAILPLLFFYLFASTFSARSFLFTTCYVMISIVFSFVVSKTSVIKSDVIKT